MALIQCKECGNAVSTTAASCPKCGAKVYKGMGLGKKLLYGFIGVAAIRMAIGVGGSGTEPEKSPSQAASVAQTTTQSKTTASQSAMKGSDPSGTAPAGTASYCEASHSRSNIMKRVNGSEHVLREFPKADAPKLVNHKATAALKETHYLTIDRSVVVLEECTQSDWSRVRVVQPSHLSDSHIGWVKSSALRDQQLRPDGKIVFSEADFDWDKQTGPYKKIIVAGVNKVHQENPRCQVIDPGSVTKSQSKGTKTDPVFFVACGEGSGVFNAFFSKSDVDKNSGGH